MRRQPEPHLVPGNYPAAQRYIRRRKPPRILLCCIGIITCLLFMGSAALLAVGYLNPFGTIGLAVLGVGAVLYFGTILFLVMTCLWVERKYPGMQPLSFKILSRKPPRTNPSAFTNPNISGQVPTSNISGYRIHNEVPFQVTGFNERKTDDVPSAPKDTAKNKNDKQPTLDSSMDPSKSNASQANSTEILQEKDCNGSTKGEDIPGVTAKTQTTNEDVNVKRDKDGKSSASDATDNTTVAHVTDGNKTDLKPEQNKNDKASSASPKRKRKVQPKTHHVEVPFEDYPSSDSSASALINNKKSSHKIQEPKPKDATQQSSTTAENYPSHSIDVSMSTTTKPQMNKEAPSNMPQLFNKDQQSAQKAPVPLSGRKIQDISQDVSHSSKAQHGRSFENNQMHHESSQVASSSELHRSPAGSPALVRKNIRVQEIQTSQENSQNKKRLIHTNSASPPVVRKETPQKRHEILPQSSNAVHKDSTASPKSSPVSAKKLLEHKKSNIQISQDSTDTVIDNAQISSLLPGRRNAFHHKHDHKNEPQNMTLSIDKDVLPKHSNIKTEALPTYAQKRESPERQKKFEKDNKPPPLPAKNRNRAISASPPRYYQRSPDSSPKAQRNQDQSLTITAHPKNEKIHKRQNYQSSQSSDVSSSTSSSPSRQRQRSPDISPKVQRTQENSISGTQVLHSKKDEFQKSHSHQSSPFSQSSDVRTSPSSSPSRHRHRSPDISPKVQRTQENSISGTQVLYSKKDEFQKSHSHQSSPFSQSSDVRSSPSSSPSRHRQRSPDSSPKFQRNSDSSTSRTKMFYPKKEEFYVPNKSGSSPLNAKKLLQYNKVQQGKSIGSQPTKDHSSELTSDRGAYKDQTILQHSDKNQRSPHSRETSPSGARASPPRNKRLEDQS